MRISSIFCLLSVLVHPKGVFHHGDPYFGLGRCEEGQFEALGYAWRWVGLVVRHSEMIVGEEEKVKNQKRVNDQGSPNVPYERHSH